MYKVPEVSYDIEGSNIVLRWNPVLDDDRLQSYAVVISRKTPFLRYPENGYLALLTVPGKAYYVVNTTQPYTDGDFGESLIPGETYYFSVTFVYKDRNIFGNSVKITVPPAPPASPSPSSN